MTELMVVEGEASHVWFESIGLGVESVSPRPATEGPPDKKKKKKD